VDVLARRSVKAESAEARAAAERDVHLLVTDHAPALRLYVDGPFRDDCDCRGRSGNSGRRRGWRNPGYEVRYDFEIRVPRDVTLRLRAVNDGEIRVQGTTGPFDIRHVNGGIELADIAGAGGARTVNGDVRVTYRANPRGEVRFKTLNGDVVARFAPALSADIWVKTFNGDVLTDYDYSRLPAVAPVAEQRGGMRVWRTSQKAGVRVGAGGPSFELETFNGDIRILRSES
jgi:hypothetical protein